MMKKKLYLAFLLFTLAFIPFAVLAAVNVNTASAEDLEALPGIGPSKAAAIVEYRDKNGPFGSVEDLTQVSGIGAKTVEALRSEVTVE